MDSHNTNNAVDDGLVNERWFTLYRYYLMAAIALCVIRHARFVVFSPYQDSLGGNFAYVIGNGVVQLGLFVFALWSIKRTGENWVRTLHLWINGVASITVVIKMFAFISGEYSLYLNVYVGLGTMFVPPIEALVPQQLFELRLGFLFYRATLIAPLIFAAYFFFRWIKSPRATLVQSPAFREHRVWAGILTVFLGFLLGIFLLALSQQMSFLSGVMSGGAPSGVSLPLPAVAIILGVMIGGLMFCGEQGRGRPMVWLAAVITPLLTFLMTFNGVLILIVLAISIYLIWVLRKSKPANESA